MLLLIAYASSEGSDEVAQALSHVRGLAVARIKLGC